MVSFTDIGSGVILLVAFAYGYSAGFLKTVLKIASYGGALAVSLFYTKDFLGWFKNVSFIVDHPWIAMICVFFIALFFLSLAVYAINLIFGDAAIFDNVFLKLLGGVCGIIVAMIIITAIFGLLQANNIDLSSYLPNFKGSYTLKVMDYINHGFNVTHSIQEIVAAFKHAASQLHVGK